MIYIVSGFMRSCTSAMMGCLDAGGMSVAYDTGKDKKMESLSYGDYQMNPRFYELLPKQLRDKRFPLNCDGHVVKMLAPGLARLPQANYKIIFMLRHPVELHASHLAAFESQLNESIANGLSSAPYPPSPGIYYFTASRIIREQRMKGRSVATVGARSMINRPLRTFCKLAEKGWPIDPAAAAAAVDPSKYRFKLEELTVRDLEWEKRKVSPYRCGGTWPSMPKKVQVLHG